MTGSGAHSTEGELLFEARVMSLTLNMSLILKYWILNAASKLRIQGEQLQSLCATKQCPKYEPTSRMEETESKETFLLAQSFVTPLSRFVITCIYMTFKDALQ